MRSLIVSALLAVPSLALAQPVPPPGTPPPPPPDASRGEPAQPQPPQQPPQQPAPQPYPQQGYPQQGYPQPYYPQPYPPQPYPPQQGYYYPQQYQPPPPPPQQRDLRNGGTFEVSLGFGSLSTSIDFNDSSNTQYDSDTEGGFAFAIGGGGWVTPDTALTGRWVALTVSREIADGYERNFTHGVLGVNVQHFLNDTFWLGGGLGIATAFESSDDDYENNDDDGEAGFGVNLRAGINFNSTSENVINASIEVLPGFYDVQGIDVRLTGVVLMLGYQHL